MSGSKTPSRQSSRAYSRSVSEYSERQSLLSATEFEKIPEKYGTNFEDSLDGKGLPRNEINQSVSFSGLFRFADTKDVLLLIVGFFASLLCGVGFPINAIIFGGLSNTFINAQSSFVNSKNVLPSSALETGWNNNTRMYRQSSQQDMTADQFMEYAVQTCVYYGILGAAVFIAGYIQMVAWQLSCERMINRIRTEFFRAILHQDITWFDTHQSGWLTSQLSDNLERIKEAIGDKFGLMIQSIMQFLAGVVIGFYYNWKLTLVMMAISPMAAVAGLIVGKLIANAAKKEQENYARAGAVAEEVLSCMRTVIAFNGQQQEIKRYEDELEFGRKDAVKKYLYGGLGMCFTNFSIFTIYGVGFWYGSLMILNGEIEQGDVFTIFFATMGGAFVLGRCGPQFSIVAAAQGAAASIWSIIDREPEIDSYSTEGKKLGRVKGKLSFKNIHFRYETRKDVIVLGRVTFEVNPGETVALVGQSGCGKSTLISLLLRYYDPTSGKITLDGENIKDLNIGWLRNVVGVVSQEPVLFDASIEENIRYGRQNVTHAEMVKACKMSNAHNFISKLPRGYKSRVGERGSQLSGGQKQRIAIARALVRDPKILLLDEATSALDAESEGVVQEALEKASKGRTTIVVAHRLSTIKNANKIIAIEGGDIKEVGTHGELMAREGLYHSLVTAQMFQSAVDDTAAGEGSGSEAGSESRKSHRSSQSGKRSSKASDVQSQASTVEERQHLMTRMLSTGTHVDTEKERLKKELEEEGAKQSSFLEILRESRGEWCYMGLGMGVAIVQGFIMPAYALMFSEIFNTYSIGGEAMRSSAVFWMIMFICLGVVDGLSQFIGEFFFGLVGENLTMDMRMRVFRNVMRQDAQFFDDARHGTGKICTRLATDAPNVKQAISWRMSVVLSASISLVLGIAIGFFYGWKLALLILATCPFLAVAAYLRLKIREGGSLEEARLMEEAGKVAVEAIESVRTVQSLTREKTFYELFCYHLRKPYQRAIKESHIQAVCYGFSTAIYFWMYAASFRFGACLVGQGEMEPLNVFRVFFGINFGAMLIGQATAFFPEYFKARFAAGLIFKMIALDPKIDSFEVAGLKPEVRGNIKFNDVHFAYPIRPSDMVLRGLEFRVDVGQTVALVGPSGCGKSTCVGLIERFYDPIHGSLIIDGTDLQTFNPKYIRSKIALVQQEPVLFDCTIEENISYGLHKVSHAKVVESAKLANIHQFILSLPEGYATRVGEKGTQLSGGQKQRVAIARALVRDPKILLLDEATSALDTESEKVVQEALDRAAQGRTCIIIAHRLSTVQNADVIAVIKHGVVAEKGTHTELVAQRGVYYNLTRKQNFAK